MSKRESQTEARTTRQTDLQTENQIGTGEKRIRRERERPAETYVRWPWGREQARGKLSWSVAEAPCGEGAGFEQRAQLSISRAGRGKWKKHRVLREDGPPGRTPCCDYL